MKIIDQSNAQELDQTLSLSIDELGSLQEENESLRSQLDEKDNVIRQLEVEN